MDEVPRAFAISDIQSSSARDEMSSVCQLCQKYDVGLKFERAEMQMIRWMCGVSLKDRRTSEVLGKLVGVHNCHKKW